MKAIKQIKHYTLTRELGRGVMGEVFEAIDNNTKKKYAIKAIASKKISDSRAFESFRQELKLLHKINHVNIIKIIAVERTTNNMYLVLEYANGGNLYEYLNYYKKRYGSPPPENTVQFFIRQVVKGLEHMHSNNIIHRDIKLENILLHFPQCNEQVDYNNCSIDEAIIKIADLGYGKELAEEGVAQTFCGTPMCMAPEIVKVYDCFNNEKSNLKQYNNKVDLWSLGTITYELIFGTPPFNGRNVNELFQHIKGGKLIMPNKSSASIEVISFLNGLLQFNPEKRLDWKGINNHVYITEKSKNFTLIDIENIDPEKNLNLQEDAKDLNNFLWVFIKPKNKEIILDKVDESILVKDNNKNKKEINIFESQHKISVYEEAKEEIDIARQTLALNNPNHNNLTNPDKNQKEMIVNTEEETIKIEYTSEKSNIKEPEITTNICDNIEKIIFAENNCAEKESNNKTNQIDCKCNINLFLKFSIF